MDSRVLYYYSDDNKKLKIAKIRYIVYGSIILGLAILLFFLEFFNGFGITMVLDYFISISMFSDMIIGIIYIVKGFLLKDKIKAKSYFNMVNSNINNDSVTSYGGIIRYLSIIPVLFNISIIVFYLLTIYMRAGEISFVMVFSLIIGFLLFISAFMAMISVDGENQIYDRIE
ncbi:MAG: hypothetical protein IKP77_04075 [Acholeplasmatales bacterium]|nr:hypothetical protein [Acholeplasmatales bacterium]